MSATIAPTSIAISPDAAVTRDALGERRHRFSQAGSESGPNATSNSAPTSGPSGSAAAVSVQTGEHDWSAEIRFAIALIANALPLRSTTAREVHLMVNQEWTPPGSSLALTDKII